MTWPALMPEEFDSLRELPRDEQFLLRLTSQSSFAVVSFFCFAADDETWTAANQGLMTSLLSWLVQEFAQFRISDVEGQQLLDTYYLHRSTLEPMLPMDVVIHIDDSTIEANSFLYGMQSPLLHSLLHGAHSAAHPLPLQAGEVTFKIFSFVHEFVSTGDLSNLWREPPEVILQVLQQANDWEIESLQDRCIELVLRYITPANVLETFLYAQQNGIVRLRGKLLAKLNELALGIVWECKEEAELAAVIYEYQESGQNILEALLPHITRFSFRGETALNPIVRTLLPRATQLRHLDLNETTGCHEELLELVTPNIESLSVQHCPWITLTWARQAVSLLYHVHRLNCGDNPDLNPMIFASYIEFPELDELDLHSLAAMNDSNFTYLMTQQRQLRELNLAWCINLSDEGIREIKAPQLRRLDLSHTKLADAGLQAVGRGCPLLQQLSIEDCTNVTEQGVISFVRQALNLRSLDARGLGLDPATCAEVRKIRKGIDLQS